MKYIRALLNLVGYFVGWLWAIGFLVCLGFGVYGLIKPLADGSLLQAVVEFSTVHEGWAYWIAGCFMGLLLGYELARYVLRRK